MWRAGRVQGSPFPVFFAAHDPNAAAAAAAATSSAPLTPSELAQKAMANLTASGLSLPGMPGMPAVGAAGMMPNMMPNMMGAGMMPGMMGAGMMPGMMGGLGGVSQTIATLQASIQSQMMAGMSAAAAPPVIEHEVEKSRTLHVGNLPPTLTVEQLKQIFGTLGPITDCRIAGDSRQFAFIEYEKPAQAVAALQVRSASFATSPAPPAQRGVGQSTTLTAASGGDSRR